MPDHARQTGIAMEKTYPFMLWLVLTVETGIRNQGAGIR